MNAQGGVCGARTPNQLIQFLCHKVLLKEEVAEERAFQF